MKRLYVDLEQHFLPNSSTMSHRVFHSAELVSHIESYLMFTAERNVAVRCNRAMNFISKIENSCVWMIHFCVHLLLCANDNFSAFPNLLRKGEPFTLTFQAVWWTSVCPHLIKPESLYKYLQWLGFYDIRLGIHAPVVGSEMRLTFEIGEERQGHRAWIPKCASTISLYSSAHPDNLEEGYAKNNPLSGALQIIKEEKEWYKYPVYEHFHDEKFMASTDKPFNLCCRLSEVLTKYYVVQTGVCPLMELYSALLLDTTWLGMFAFVFYEHLTFGSMIETEIAYMNVLNVVDDTITDYGLGTRADNRGERLQGKWSYGTQVDGESVRIDMPPFIGLFRQSMMYINVRNLNPRAWLLGACLREFPILDRICFHSNQEMADELIRKSRQFSQFMDTLTKPEQERLRREVLHGRGIIPRTTVLRTKVDPERSDYSYWTRLPTKAYMVSVLGYAFPRCLMPTPLFYNMMETDINMTKLTNFHYEGHVLRYFDVDFYKIHPGVMDALGSLCCVWDRYPLPQQNRIADMTRISTDSLEDHLVLYGCKIYKYGWNQPGKNDLFVYTNTNRGLKGYKYFDENVLHTPPPSPPPPTSPFPSPPRLVRQENLDQARRNVRRRIEEIFPVDEDVIDLTQHSTPARTRSGRIYNLEVLMPSLPPSDLLDF